MLRFGPAGNAESFALLGYKNNLGVPEYLSKMGLSAYEYQAGRGVKISEASAKAFGEKAKEKDISLSIHAPYYISLSSAEEDRKSTRLNSSHIQKSHMQSSA